MTQKDITKLPVLSNNFSTYYNNFNKVNFIEINKLPQPEGEYEEDKYMAAFFLETANYLENQLNTYLKCSCITNELLFDEGKEIIWQIVEAICFYDFELNFDDGSRFFALNIQNNYLQYYFKFMVYAENIDVLLQYLSDRKELHHNHNTKYIANTYSIERKNKANKDLKHLINLIDTVMEELNNEIEFAVTKVNDKFTQIELVFLSNTICPC